VIIIAFTDFGLIQLGSFIVGDSPTTPQYMAIGIGSTVFDGAENYLGSEFLRKTITWSTFENIPQGNVAISTIDANGSFIRELGMGQGASLGSDLYSRNLSSIGEKNSTFDVNVVFEVRFERV